MNKGLEELKRLAYENACCRCQYYIDKKCTNNGECVWKTIEKELKELEERREMMRRFNEACVPMILDNKTEQKLKALEIIKEKEVSIDYLMVSINYDKEKALDYYNQWTMEYGIICLPLTQEEYDLLKEILL